MSGTAPNLGLRLKAERERKGMTAQKAADDLHLDPWVIEALESGDYGRIGPAVYAKGHLKHYAALLGLPSDDILAAYDGGTVTTVAVAVAPVMRFTTVYDAGRRTQWLPIAAGGVGAMLVGVGLLLWHPWRRQDAPVTAGNTATSPTAVASSAAATATATATAAAARTEPVTDGVSERVASAAALAPATAVPAEVVPGGPAPGRGVDGRGVDGRAVPGRGRARLRLSFSADSRVDVRDANGRQLFSGKGRANTVKTLAGAAPMTVYLGFASGVQLQLNNHVVAIGPQFLVGDVARFAAGADGVLRREAYPAVPAPAPTAAPSTVPTAVRLPTAGAAGAQPRG